ncbi:HD-GYP domain-containing protein [Iodobacter fluviatilis]|uniref:Phosphodiesterase n=1 Tax=Iodobacter fluviatilis TaxID=537 RepID=A0A7G3G982_9NEIS|nr:HD-GYP domain-containing protein [Iodobacter fluviatilis]QBC43355.1 phosphodiesterase [Iodobacter fluviatilis]
MIKKIPSSVLKIGMYIHDLNVDWMDHPFLRKQFVVKTEEDLQKIMASGAHEVYIDTDRGLDYAHAPTVDEVNATIEAEMVLAATAPAPVIQVSTTEEMSRAKKIHKQAHSLVRTVMQDARMGKAIHMDDVEEVVEAITDSILRNSSALLGLSGIKDKDEYTFLHSVSVCTLMVTFAKSMNFPSELIRQAGIGGLLHDTGKTMVPNEILNKPGRLTEAEFEVMRSHPMEGFKILSQVDSIGDIPLEITLHHHERMDGSGYPHRLPGENITQLTQMASVVDVYDAITSDRCYHKGMPASEGLKKLWEWSKFHFNPTLVQAFMRTVGIYPVGSLVKLESGRLAVVLEQNEGNLLMPRVKAIFSTKANAYITPVEINLAKPMGLGGADKITGHESPEKWNIDVSRFLIPPS